MKRVQTFLFSGLVLALAVSLAGGCASGRVRLAVNNVGESPLLDIVVLSDSEILLHARRLTRLSATPEVRLSAPPTGETVVQWTGADGITRRRKVVAGEPVPARFRGVFLVQIGREDDVRLFVIPERSADKQDIPWARPESWEGYPGIPGLTHE